MAKTIFIPSVFTLCNLFFGFLSIVKATEGNLVQSAWFIIIAVLFDGMDGKIARWTHTESMFGFHLDSLTDLVSVGVAPAVLIYLGPLSEWFVFRTIVCFLFLLAGGYRLARFNVLKAGDRSQGYTGLPTPVAGLLVASFYLLNAYTGIRMDTETVWSILACSSIVLMVSAVPYSWPGLSFVDRTSSLKSIGILGIVITMALVPRQALFPVFLYYTVLGIGKWLIAVFLGRKTIRSFFLVGSEG